jgi:hypothetical protein
MNPICAEVDAANNCLTSRCQIATRPSRTAVATPIPAAAESAQPVVRNRGSMRSRRNEPAATIVAECRSALTGLGPSIARDSQNENGSCADFPAAATTSPAATTCT